MKVIRAGIIGSGFMGGAHIEALRRIGGVDVVAIADINRAGAETLADKFGIDGVYTNWKSLIEDPDIQVVHNCTPNHLHFGINREVIMAGKHIISEKPLTLRPEESAELLALLRTRRVVHAINFNYRFYPVIQHARALMKRGEIGDLYLVHGTYLQDWLYYSSDYNWRLKPDQGGVSRAVADIGSHWCDMIQFITGLKIRRVFAELITIHKQRQKPETDTVETFKGKESERQVSGIDFKVKTEDAGIVVLEFDHGIRGVFTVSQVSAGRKNYFSLEIDGSKRSLAWNQEEPNQLWIGYREKPNEIVIKDPSLLEEGSRKYAHYPGGHPEGYPVGLKNLCMNVYQYIREEKEPGKDDMEFPNFSDGHNENVMVDAVLRSNREKRWTELDYKT